MSDPAVTSRSASTPASSVAKEQLTAYQRWELASFDETSEIDTHAKLQTATATEKTAEQLADELKEVQRLSHEAGYAAGEQAGKQAGFQQGVQQTQFETAQFQTLMDNLQIALNQIDEQLAQSLLDLSLEVAQKMVVEVLKIKPEVILKIVSTAIGSLPHFNQNAHLILHPTDAELVRAQMSEQLAQAGWKIFTDAQIAQGGCRIETAHSNVDASNTARWKHIVESIGQDKSWLS